MLLWIILLLLGLISVLKSVLSRFLLNFCFFDFEETVLEELYVYFTDKVNGFILQTCSELNFYCLGVVVGSQVFPPVFLLLNYFFCYLLSEFFLFFTGNSDWIFLYSVIFEDFVAFVAFFRLQSKNFEFFLI
jgi:hypothetical protein